MGLDIRSMTEEEALNVPFDFPEQGEVATPPLLTEPTPSQINALRTKAIAMHATAARQINRTTDLIIGNISNTLAQNS